MPIRGRTSRLVAVGAGENTTTTFPGLDQAVQFEDEIENLREGTREQYESGWVFIPDTHSLAFRHNLGEIPWGVSVIRSAESDGRVPVEASGDVTVAYSDVDGTRGTETTHIKVTNNLGSDAYFQVRAL